MLLDFVVDVWDTEGNIMVGANFNNNFGLRASRKLNGIGVLEIVLSEDQERFAKVDYLVDVNLRYIDGTIRPFRSYFIKKRRFTRRGDTNYFIAGGLCLNYLLTSRAIAYAKGSAQASQTDQADDMLKEIARDNIGGDAVTARDKSSYLSIEGNKAECTSISREMSWQPLWDVMQGIREDLAASSGTQVYFDVVKIAPYTFELKTYKDLIGVDRTSLGHIIKQQFFSPNLENINNPDLVEDYSDEVTYVYALPPASGSARVPVEVYDAERLRRSAFARREAVVSVNSGDTAELTSAANTALNKGRPRYHFRADLLNTADFRYGVHWNIGDKVGVVWRGQHTGIVDYVEVGRTQRGEGFEDHFKASLEIEDVLR